MLNQALHAKNRKCEDLLTNLGKIYRKGRLCMYTNYQGMIYDQYDNAISISSEIILTLRKMPKQYGMILIHDYFEPAEKDWWSKCYTKYQYRRLKHKSIDLFFELLPNYCITDYILAY